MAVPVTLNNERIGLRTSSKEKNILKRAAELKHLSLSSYIIAASLHQAQLDLEKEEVITLSNHDRDCLMSMLSNPPEPTIALKKLFQ